MPKLIPSEEVMITKMEYPPGWYVGAYDYQGFVIEGKMFCGLERKAEAEQYSKQLEEKAWQ